MQPFFILKMLGLQETGLVLRRDRMCEVCCDRTRAECCRVSLIVLTSSFPLQREGPGAG